MCQVFWLAPNVMPKKEDFYNCVYNNWHGYGLVTKVGKKLDIKRAVPAENDPAELWGMLEENLEYERFLHLRHATAGDLSLINAHPFDVISSSKGDVVFMHNGSLSGQDPKTMAAISADDPRKKWSDTKYWVETFLTPYLASLKTVDIHDANLKMIIGTFWQQNNRGILISSHQKPATLGTWVTMKGEDEKVYFAANDTYFRDVIRGPEKDRREKIKSEARQREVANGNVIPFGDGKNLQGKLRSEHFTKVFGVTQQFKDIINDPALYEDSNLEFLCNLTPMEVAYMFDKLDANEEKDSWHFIGYILNSIHEKISENRQLRRKVESASKLIEMHRKIYPDLPKKTQGLETDPFDRLVVPGEAIVEPIDINEVPEREVHIG